MSTPVRRRKVENDYVAPSTEESTDTIQVEPVQNATPTLEVYKWALQALIKQAPDFNPNATARDCGEFNSAYREWLNALKHASE